MKLGHLYTRSRYLYTGSRYLYDQEEDQDIWIINLLSNSVYIGIVEVKSKNHNGSTNPFSVLADCL